MEELQLLHDEALAQLMEEVSPRQNLGAQSKLIASSSHDAPESKESPESSEKSLDLNAMD